MARKKDYLKMFVDFCQKHNVHWQICGDGSIDQIFFCDMEVELEASANINLGTKKAYDWLVKEYNKETGGRCQHCGQLI